ncbi:unnamed protein product [Zymoseptoria tritici ST99CH_3D1]|uniref:C2H2-type domain-containing protein n=1 Tax=Zymoseptoria tritici ST99CH_1E4 TaxID=1276532 RepID=A0A2H1FMX6_ZYMTR|nr:unnamed protein product [Zymoseptoria tritici ST99CH_1E4]SMR44855.1 unnamed protein product [Zymoseptoria tritici ST99CH_3D1]
MESFNQTYWDFNSDNYSNFNDVNQNTNFNARQQTYHASHRASAPMAYNLPRPPMEDSLDLSSFDALAQNTVHNVGLEDVIKPEHNTPWSGTQRSGMQQNLQPTLGRSSYVRSEPALKQDRTSDAADSGYYEQLGTMGMQEYNTNRPELEQDYGYFPSSHSGKVAADRMSVVSDGYSRLPRERRIRRTLAPCQACGRSPKNQSDSKKHSLTHSRPYRCLEPNCTRKDGFATENDLQRHRKSVHNLLPTVGATAGYICAACPQDGNTPHKFWPRRDNFKAHIKRKHPKHNDVELMERSRHSMRPDDTRTVVTDVQSVRSGLHSVYQSEADANESHGYQPTNHMDLPTLSRHGSMSGESGAIFGPDSAVSMASTEQTLVGMHGHTANLMLPYNNAFLDDNDMSGLSILSTAADNLAYNHSPNHDLAVSSSITQRSFSTFNQQQRPAPPPFSVQQPTSSSTTTTGPRTCPYPNCTTSWSRPCDLTKHLKRHTKPYGCTFPRCSQKSGSRGDWKRHENSNHYMATMWRCGRRKMNGSVCVRRPFQREESLRDHLRGLEHGMEDEVEVERAVEEGKLGEEGKGQFWCGFCCAVVMQREGEESAWAARLRHVGDHFDKERLSIDEWVCVVENRKKKYIVEAEERREVAMGRKKGGEVVEAESELEEWSPDLSEFGTRGMMEE